MRLTRNERLILAEASRIERSLRENASKRLFFWEPASGESLTKIARIFPEVYKDDIWYVLNEKIRGKTVFGRDHGVWTLYVLGADDNFYSIKFHGGEPDLNEPETYREINQLVDSARTGESPVGSGIYRNFRSFEGRRGIRRNSLNEMPKGIARDPASDLRQTGIADLRARATKLGIDVASYGRNKRALMQAIKDAERINPDVLCHWIDSFGRSIGAEIYEPCTQTEPKRFEIDWRHWDLSKDFDSWDDDDDFNWQELEEEQMIENWRDRLRVKLQNTFGDVFSRISLHRGDKNYLEGEVILK